jgi:hypothetical protein
MGSRVAPAPRLCALAEIPLRLRDEGYVGDIDVNGIVNANGIYPLEFTARLDIGDRWSEEDSDRLHSWGISASREPELAV